MYFNVSCPICSPVALRRRQLNGKVVGRKTWHRFAWNFVFFFSTTKATDSRYTTSSFFSLSVRFLPICYFLVGWNFRSKLRKVLWHRRHGARICCVCKQHLCSRFGTWKPEICRRCLMNWDDHLSWDKLSGFGLVKPSRKGRLFLFSDMAEVFQILAGAVGWVKSLVQLGHQTKGKWWSHHSVLGRRNSWSWLRPVWHQKKKPVFSKFPTKNEWLVGATRRFWTPKNEPNVDFLLFFSTFFGGIWSLGLLGLVGSQGDRSLLEFGLDSSKQLLAFGVLHLLGTSLSLSELLSEVRKGSWRKTDQWSCFFASVCVTMLFWDFGFYHAFTVSCCFLFNGWNQATLGVAVEYLLLRSCSPWIFEQMLQNKANHFLIETLFFLRSTPFELWQLAVAIWFNSRPNWSTF